MDGPAIITQVTNPKEEEARSPGGGEKGEEGHKQLPQGRECILCRSRSRCAPTRAWGKGVPGQEGEWVWGAPGAEGGCEGACAS